MLIRLAIHASQRHHSFSLYRMASQVNIYSQLLISIIRIADINHSNCWYRYL